MRTTVELTDRQRAKLLELAAERGEKGFSRLVQEAVDLYLKHNAGRERRVSSAVSVLGSFSADEADQLEESCRAIRGVWR